MKKILLFLILAAGYKYSSAQEMLQGGNMEDESSWIIIDVGSAFDPATITFGYTSDQPSAGKEGCLSIAGYGATHNYIYQKVTLKKDHTYYLSCALKNASDADIVNYWLEVNLVQKVPKLSGEGTNADFGASKSDFQLGMHFWKNLNGIDYTHVPDGYDGLMKKTINFAYLGAANGKDSIITNPRDPNFKGKHGDSIIFTLPDTVKNTEWYVLIKAGAGMTKGATTPAFNWLLDELTLWDIAQPMTNSIANTNSSINTFEVFPNPVTDGMVHLKSNSMKETSYQVYNTLGEVVKSGLTKDAINLNGVSKGLYLLRLGNGAQAELHRLIIK